MVYISDEFCALHQKQTKHINGKCVLCNKEKEEQELKVWEASRSLEERVRDLYMRLKKIEAGEPRY